MAVILTDLGLNEACKIKVTKEYKVNLPSFGMLGNTERITKVASLDMHSILQDLSRNSSWFFWTLIKKRNPKTNLVDFIPQNNLEAKKVTNAYKELRDLGVIKRVQRGVYIINPRAYIPSDNQFEIVQAHWDSV